MTIDIIGHLTELGFTDYEARAYTALVRRNPLTGYELAKISGVPRPNIYAVVERLQQKGAALAMGTNGGVKYAPVPPGELLGKLSKSFESHIQEASRSLTQVQSIPQADYIWHLQGYSNVMERAVSMIENAQQQVLLGLWPAEFQLLAPSLRQLKVRGIEPTVLCFQGTVPDMGESITKIYKLPIVRDGGTSWFVLIVDETELLTAEIQPNGEAQGAWTRQKLFMATATWYIRHSIAVAEIVRSLGPRLRQLLDKEALSVIEGASLATIDGKPWLEGLLQAMDKGVNNPDKGFP